MVVVMMMMMMMIIIIITLTVIKSSGLAGFQKVLVIDQALHSHHSLKIFEL
jgi:hypothetical protein